MSPTLAHTKSNLKERIRTRQLRSGIIGLGYVGLPLAVEFAKAGIEVYGMDIDTAKVAQIRQGKSYIQDVPNDIVQNLVAKKKLNATSDFSIIRDLDTVNICVPTPLRKSRDPDISYINAAANEVAKYLHEDMLVILESTTYPGTTEEVILPLLEAKGFKVGKDFYLAFSPERIDPGNSAYKTRNIPKIVGGITKECTQLAEAFFSIAIENIHCVSSSRAAEMTKLLENTFRSVNIGLVNEMCLMSEKLGVNIWEIIDAAATKPFGFIPFYPGPGLGGHCIPIDPHYLAWKARFNKFSPRFIELASEINASMPEFVVRRAQAVLNEGKKSLNGSRILILGVSYKKNVDDVRESPALEIMELLEKNGSKISYSDPHVPELMSHDKVYRSENLDSLKAKVDLAILITDHKQFDYKKILESFPKILDTRNAFRGISSDKIIRI